MAEPSAVPSDFIGAIKKHARLALIIGILMVICGVLAIASPLAAGVYVTILVGLMLAFGGIAQCFLAFRAGAFGKGLMIFIVGALTAVLGFFLFNQPLEGLVSITLLLAAYFVVTGIFELIHAFQMRPAGGWGLMLFNGVVTLLLGIMIWSQFPLSGVWAVGILFGVKLIMSGWALISIGRSVRGATDASA